MILKAIISSHSKYIGLISNWKHVYDITSNHCFPSLVNATRDMSLLCFTFSYVWVEFGWAFFCKFAFLFLTHQLQVTAFSFTSNMGLAKHLIIYIFCLCQYPETCAYFGPFTVCLAGLTNASFAGEFLAYWL